MEAECSIRVFNFPEKCRKCCVDLFLSVVSFEQLANLFSIFWEEEQGEEEEMQLVIISPHSKLF